MQVPPGDRGETRAERDRRLARREARYWEQVAAVARLQAAGVSLGDLGRVKVLFDSGRFTDWPDAERTGGS